MELYKRKKQEQFSSFHDRANWTLASGQVNCCFVEKGDGLQTSVGPLEKLREKSGYFWDFLGYVFGIIVDIFVIFLNFFFNIKK